MTSKTTAPRELELVLNAPIGPQRLHDDTVVIDEGGWYRTITPSSSWPASNEILFSNLDPQAADAEINAVIQEYHDLGLPLTWCVYPWTQPYDLGKRLLARGATQSVIQAFIGSTSIPLKVVPGVEVELIAPESTESFEAYINLISVGNQLPPDEAAFRRSRYRQLSSGADPCMQLFLARCNGVAAGGSALILKKDHAHMTGAYVEPTFQARGVFQSLKAAAVNFLRERGISLFTGHANKQSAFWVERFGSRPIYSYSIYQLDPPSTGG